MIPNWDTFIDELQQLSTDKRALEFLDGQVIKKALLKVEEEQDQNMLLILIISF